MVEAICWCRNGNGDAEKKLKTDISADTFCSQDFALCKMSFWKMSLSGFTVTCFYDGFPGILGSSHPAPRVLRANKNVSGRQ